MREMAEYRHSAHAVFEVKYHLIWCTKYRYKILRGRVAERARDLIRQISQARDGDHSGRGVAGSHTYVGLGAADTVAGEAGAIHQGKVEPPFAGGVPGPAKAVLGTTHVGTRVLLRDGGRGGRGNDQGLYIESQKWDEDDQGFKITAPNEP